MYKYKEFWLASDLIDFLNKNKIPKENILKIEMVYNAFVLIYYKEETGTETDTKNVDEIFSDMKAEMEKVFNTESEVK